MTQAINFDFNTTASILEAELNLKLPSMICRHASSPTGNSN
ncbi:unnamed protein product [Amoebophrya sp. A25]|nr:unnamed protein product [Amoebophrya sp. A25]|eukprot:GSA25T00007718001.1